MCEKYTDSPCSWQLAVHSQKSPQPAVLALSVQLRVCVSVCARQACTDRRASEYCVCVCVCVCACVRAFVRAFACVSSRVASSRTHHIARFSTEMKRQNIPAALRIRRRNMQLYLEPPCRSSISKKIKKKFSRLFVKKCPQNYVVKRRKAK